MSQAQVTDFFSHRKKGSVDPVKASPTTGSSRSKAPENEAAAWCSSAVHEEFLRVIDEAAGLTGGEAAAAGHGASSPRTPKRSSEEAEFDLGAAVFSASAPRSPAKKSRRAETKAADKTVRRTARKKLVLPGEKLQAAPQPPPSDAVLQPPAPAAPECAQTTKNHADPQPKSSPLQGQVKNSGGETTKALCKEDIAALKSRLQKIKKQAAKTTSVASSPSGPTSSASTTPTNTTSPVPKAAAARPTSDAKALKLSVARARELAAKAQRRKEEREAEEKTQSDSTEQPAYQRYHTLAQAVPPGLSLPYSYKLLAEMFRSMDTVVAMLYNRCETATFAKIKRGVQDMMHKRFEECHVGQIKMVFPEAYSFRQEKNIPTFNSSMKKGSYQLTVEPIIPSDQNGARPALSASRLLERRQIFHSNLVSIVKQHHKVFLSSLVPPLSVPEDKLTRWHPGFSVDTVPAVQTSSLPQVPQTDKMATAQEVLDKARSLITPKMEKALVSLTLKTEEKAAENQESTSPKNPTAPQMPTSSAALKGVSQSLLDRIRAKEAQKLQAAMTRNSDQEERLLMMSRLGELARILRSVFVAEKKPALIMEVACNRMVASYRSALSTGEMEKHLRLLAEVAADWLTILPIRKDSYLRLNKNLELSLVLEKLSRRLREEEHFQAGATE